MTCFSFFDIIFKKGMVRLMLVLLSEWCKLHKKDLSYATKKCRNGSYKSAVKIGRQWFIDSDEPNVDFRFKDDKDFN